MAAKLRWAFLVCALLAPSVAAIAADVRPAPGKADTGRIEIGDHTIGIRRVERCRKNIEREQLAAIALFDEVHHRSKDFVCNREHVYPPQFPKDTDAQTLQPDTVSVCRLVHIVHMVVAAGALASRSGTSLCSVARMAPI